MSKILKYLPEILVGTASGFLFVYMFIIGRTAAGGVLLALVPVAIYLAWNYLSVGWDGGGSVT